MKKLLLFLLPLLLFVFVPFSHALATDSSPSAMVSPTPIPSSNYTLPYPGLLPDSPLYIFKLVRDQIVMFFISDPLKKSDFMLLQGDKRIEASWYLMKKGQSKYDLALSTLTKSTNYLYNSLSQLQQAMKSGEDITALHGRLHDAILKHQEVIQEMQTLFGLKNNTTLAGELKRLADLEKSVLAISPK